MAEDIIGTVTKAAKELSKQIKGRTPKIGIVLGSGLGLLAGKIEDQIVVPYTKLPGYPKATALGHKGNFISGKLGGKDVIAMEGRFHYYEGYGIQTVVLPIRTMIKLGIEYLFVSNAAGGMNKTFKIGDLMMIRDHINLIPNPLIGPNFDEFGPRFPDMTCPYDLSLQRKMTAIAKKEGITLKKGVYVSTTGPTYETPAEYGYFKAIGGDAVGMSTTPEVIVARHSGVKVLGISVITDIPHSIDDDYVTDGEEVIRQANKAALKMCTIFEKLIESL